MPYKVTQKSNQPINEYHVGMRNGYVTPHFFRIDAGVMNSTEGFTIPCSVNYNMTLTPKQYLTFYPITEGHVYLDPFRVYVKTYKPPKINV